MTFRKRKSKASAPEFPDLILETLTRKRIPGVLPHQQHMTREFAKQAAASPDVALQLPTGSGKTLVGLLIGEWLRRKNDEKVVYLCPTKQLVNQTATQAIEKYGLDVLNFTGKITNYETSAKASYELREHLSVTTYSSLFNVNPFFKDADVLIFDDVHAAENYISSMWSIVVNRSEPDHAGLHDALASVIGSQVGPNIKRKIKGSDAEHTAGWVDMLAGPKLLSIEDGIRAVGDEFCKGDLAYAWQLLRDHLSACQVYFSDRAILIRPTVPPTWTHAPFATPRQRIYMSATLSRGGDLHRITGRESIDEIPAPPEMDRQGVGRRFFIFPALSLDEDDALASCSAMISRAGRGLVLVPSKQAASAFQSAVLDALPHAVYGADDIEKSKESFIKSPQAVALVANRYDGIDFRGEECRLLIVSGLPKATNLQERFLMSRMAANALYNERVQTRVLQAIGRCTRSFDDSSAVVVLGEDLQRHLVHKDARQFLDPELQAEIEFGVDQSRDVSSSVLVANLDLFLRNEDEWTDANAQIIDSRAEFERADFPAMAELSETAPHELQFQRALWNQDSEAALNAARDVLGSLGHTDLRGYRAWWFYLAGCAATLSTRLGAMDRKSEQRDYFARAKNAAPSLHWLSRLTEHDDDDASAEEEATLSTRVACQLEGIETQLADLQMTHNRKFNQRVDSIREGLKSSEPKDFERGHESLGRLLGFEAGNEETRAAPDPWWVADELCIVFEDHSDGSSKNPIGANKIRQAASHPNWIRAKEDLAHVKETVPVLVTPTVRAEEGADPHFSSLLVWPIDDFRAWAEAALATIVRIRRTFREPGDLGWRAYAVEQLEANATDVDGLLRMLTQRPAALHYGLNPEA